MDATELKKILDDHKAWLEDRGGSCADLRDKDLNRARLNGASLNRASLNRARLNRARLNGASLDGASLDDARLNRARLNGASLDGASLDDARLNGTVGEMKHIRSLQIDTWAVAYTSDVLQIGCQSHAIEKWRRWDSDAGRKWIDAMDSRALAWAEKYLALVLTVIDAAPAAPTGYAEPASEPAAETEQSAEVSHA